MKTSEFIRKVEGLGYEVINGVDFIRVRSDFDTVSTVFKTKFNTLDTNWCEDVPSELFDVLVEYAKTPIEDREDVKKYYLYNPVKDLYFNYSHELELYGWGHVVKTNSYQTQFTVEEIKNNPYRDIMELLEKVEVE